VNRTLFNAVGGRRIGSGEGEEGQGLAEYALILAFIAIISIAIVTLIGGQISSQLSDIGVAV
jgi:Flp pilus assembly pilin Flp